MSLSPGVNCQLGFSLSKGGNSCKILSVYLLQGALIKRDLGKGKSRVGEWFIR